MKRKEFLHMAGMMGLGSLVVPQLPFGSRIIDPSEALQGGMDVATKKQLADIALNAAKSGTGDCQYGIVWGGDQGHCKWELGFCGYE